MSAKFLPYTFFPQDMHLASGTRVSISQDDSSKTVWQANTFTDLGLAAWTS